MRAAIRPDHSGKNFLESTAMANDRNTIVVVEDVTLIRSTDKAGLYEDCDGFAFWIPFSVLKEDSVDKDGENGDIRIPLWLAEAKELEYVEE